MMHCPTNALRIRGGKVILHKNDWCIDCGECLIVCPHHAVYAVQDDFNHIFDYKCRVALLPASFIGQFSKRRREEDIFDALYALGFTHIYQVEVTAELIRDEMQRRISEAAEKPVISVFCPSVVRLIQIRFPSLVDHLLTLKTPVGATALLYRKQLEDEGYAPEDIGIFYVTPCAAKIAEIKSDTDNMRQIQGVINMDFLYNKVWYVLSNRSQYPVKGGDVPLPLTECEMCWSLPGGEAGCFEGRNLAIDEMHNVIDFLEQLENTTAIQNVNFLELRACDQGCVGGVLTPANRFLAAERIRHRAKKYIGPSHLSNTVSAENIQMLHNNIEAQEIEARIKHVFDGTRQEVLHKMERVEAIVKMLPGIDCGACGAPSCHAMAEDIMRGEAKLKNCLLLMRTMEINNVMQSENVNNIIEDIWGKERLLKTTQINTSNEN